MSTSPFRVTKTHLHDLKSAAKATLVRAENFTLPSIPVTHIPEGRGRECGLCGICYGDNMVGTTHQDQWEQALVLPCGHLGGEICLRWWLDTKNPVCVWCNVEYRIVRIGQVGVHGNLPSMGEVGLPGYCKGMALPYRFRADPSLGLQGERVLEENLAENNASQITVRQRTDDVNNAFGSGDRDGSHWLLLPGVVDPGVGQPELDPRQCDDQDGE